MQAVVMNRIGGPEVLTVEDRPVPQPGPGQVLVRTEAIATTIGECMIRAGRFPLTVPLPAVLGSDAVGTVESLGTEADPTLAGARVTFITGGFGSYAEYVAVDVGLLSRVPTGVEPTDAAAVAAPGATALALLSRAELGEGESVLVENASTAVGGYLLQLLPSSAPGRVVATVSNPAKSERARALGADVVVSHDDPLITPDRRPTDDLRPDAAAAETIDVAFASLGGPQLQRSVAALTPGTGRLFYYGSTTEGPAQLDATTLLYRGVRVIGCGGPNWYDDVLHTARPAILEELAAGRVRPMIDSVRPLHEAAQAHRDIEARTTSGRIILVP